MSVSETEGGVEAWDSGMQDFKDCIEDISVTDLRASGPLFTWWNSQTLNLMYKKLDRVMVNHLWLTAFPNS